MRILLIGMPDTISGLDVVMKIPNLGLCSIAAGLEGHETKILDLVFHNHGIRRYLDGILSDFQPELVGLTAMSYQYDSACRVARICRTVLPQARIALGGYHSTLMADEIGNSQQMFDFLVRGEGEGTFARLAAELASGGSAFPTIPGLSWRHNGNFEHNNPPELLDLNQLKLPARGARIIDRASMLGIPFDCVETSRGCTMNCNFCSINVMYGRKVRMFPLERVISDLESLRESGKKGVFFVDDNITLNVPRLKNLCQMIIDRKLDSLNYIVQASVAGIASDPGLAAIMKRAGFKWVFLGIESNIARNLAAMGKEGVLNNAQKAVSLLRDEGIGVWGGFIIGHPEDGAADIRSAFRAALELGVDHPVMQCLTPYPKTRTRQEMLEKGLVTNKDDFSRYNGFTCNIRTERLSNRQLNNAIFWNGLRLYFHPRYLTRSRFWNYRLSLLPAFIATNFRYLAGALKGRIFMSRHRW
jgi:anaerobic magnesium-protoporphyrin IX monomethyl ester cyclase